MRLVIFINACLLIHATSLAASEDLADARSLMQTGDYVQAGEAYEAFLESDTVDEASRVAAVLGLSASHQSRGLWKAATDVITTQLVQTPNHADLNARLAELKYLQGQWEEAAVSAEVAVKQDDDQLLARLIIAHLTAERGDLDEASDAYRWFVRYYNRKQPTDAETLMLVAAGSVQYARWKSVSSIFNFVVNTLSVDALADDPQCWQASLLSGELLLEKYNKPQAKEEFEAALAINPRAAEVIVAQGQAALLDHELEQALDFAKEAIQINPALPAALLLAADVSIATGELQSAMEFVKQARKVNPVDQRIQARLAGIVLLDDGLPETDVFAAVMSEEFDSLPEDVSDSRFVKTYRKVLMSNPKPGPFLSDVGEILDGRRKYDAAEQCFRRAIEVMPQLSVPRTSLGMLAMRTGDLEEAQSILDAAFEADPFHVRVSNMRKVLKQLDDYETIASDHFVIRVPESEKLLGEAMADYLEETYAELTALFGFEPATRTQFEVYGPAGGTSAHQWFSARMVGLPWVQTIGASTGVIVAMASPNDGDKPFNWARVVRHEFVHILTLQQTRFNIPHWYTEALAVRTEGVTPPEWDTLLLRRVPAGEVFTLADINAGFQRPDGPDDWQMAYCQSWLYAQFIAERFGEESHARLLDAYRRNLSTSNAIVEVCGISLEKFEAEYTEYLNKYVETLRGTRTAPPQSIEAAQAHWRDNPTDREAQAQLAWAMWNADRKREAFDIAEKLLEDTPDQHLAIAIVAESHLREGAVSLAEELLESALDTDNPQPDLLERLALVHVARREWSAAVEVWRQAADRWPREPRFLKGLAASIIRLDDEAALRPVLVQLAELDADDLLSRKKLATLALQGEDWETALKWSTAALQIDVTDASMHRVRADALEATGKSDEAARERAVLEQLKP